MKENGSRSRLHTQLGSLEAYGSFKKPNLTPLQKKAAFSKSRRSDISGIEAQIAVENEILNQYGSPDQSVSVASGARKARPSSSISKLIQDINLEDSSSKKSDSKIEDKVGNSTQFLDESTRIASGGAFIRTQIYQDKSSFIVDFSLQGKDKFDKTQEVKRSRPTSPQPPNE